MNNKGFTLIELMAAIILLSIITTVSATVVVNILENSKEKSYDLLVESIKIGAQEYFEECENINIIDSSLPDEACKNIIKEECDSGINKCMTVPLKNLVKHGFLKSSATNSDGDKIVENPKDNEDISNCEITVNKSIENNFSTSYTFKSGSSGGTSCPTY